MNDRKKILDLFEQQKEYTDKRVSEDIEKYRKGILGALPDPELINSLLDLKGNNPESSKHAS